MVTPEDLERERYEARFKFKADLFTAYGAAYDEGFEEAYGLGPKPASYELGRRIAVLVHIIRLYQRFLERVETPTAQLRALPLEDLQRLYQQLEAELTPSRSASS